MDRIFLDANVLYSVSYLERSALARLWNIREVELMSSAYAMEEARRNLAIDRPEALSRLQRFAQTLSIVDAPRGLTLPASIRLDAKDRPILLAAIHASASYLLTGDARHFGHLYDERVEGVLVLRPAQYLLRHQHGRNV